MKKYYFAGRLQAHLDVVKKMKPRDIDSFVPLLKMTLRSLRRASSWDDDDAALQKSGYSNRIDYISEQMQVKQLLS